MNEKCCEIPLTRGKIALVDAADFEWLNQWKWRANANSKTFYAMRSSYRKAILMHRLITNAPKGMDVDHIDGNSLNNQRKNLRVCSRSQNMGNTGQYCTNTTGFKGVSFVKDIGKWKAEIGRPSTYLGCFESPEEAHLMYCMAAHSYYGNFASV